VALIRKKGDKYTSRMRPWSGSCGLLLAAVFLVLSAESQYGYAQAILGALAVVFIALAITAFRGLCVNFGESSLIVRERFLSRSLPYDDHSEVVAMQDLVWLSRRVFLRYATRSGRVYDKVAEGKTKKEAIRSLKRQISNAVYRQLLFDAR
jgi:hypothetical protein